MVSGKITLIFLEAEAGIRKVLEKEENLEYFLRSFFVEFGFVEIIPCSLAIH